MRRVEKVMAGLSLALLVCSPLRVQDDYSDKINTNLGAAASVPLSPTSKFVNTSWGLSAGAAYNFSPPHPVIGEFMWSALYALLEMGFSPTTDDMHGCVRLDPGLIFRFQRCLPLVCNPRKVKPGDVGL